MTEEFLADCIMLEEELISLKARLADQDVIIENLERENKRLRKRISTVTEICKFERIKYAKLSGTLPPCTEQSEETTEPSSQAETPDEE